MCARPVVTILILVIPMILPLPLGAQQKIVGSELENFCNLAGLPVDAIATNHDENTAYDHGEIISAATLTKLGFKKMNEWLAKS